MAISKLKQTATLTTQLLLLPLFLIPLLPPASATADSVCEYPCYLPPTGAAGDSTATYTPPSSGKYYYYPPPSTGYSLQPPPAPATSTDAGYYYPPPSNGYIGGSYGDGSGSVPSPPDPILPYFPYYYRNGVHNDKGSSSSLSVGGQRQPRLWTAYVLLPIFTLPVVLDLFFL